MITPPYVVIVLSVVLFFGIGICCLFWPEQIQRIAITFGIKKGNANRFNLFSGWVKSHSYIVTLRIIGACAIGAGMILAFLLKH